MHEEYRPSRVRQLAVRLHGWMVRAGFRVERLSDWVAQIAGAFLLLIVLALISWVWLPMTGTLVDFLIWLVIPIVLTLALAALLRALRRRRHGPKPSTAVQGASDVLALVFCGWFGLVALGACVASDEVTGGMVFFGCVGAAALVLGGVLVVRYVAKE